MTSTKPSAGSHRPVRRPLWRQVKVYVVGDYSKEICGGPHVQHTAQVGRFKILKEEASSAGVRRIKAMSNENYLVTVPRASSASMSPSACLSAATP